MNPYVDAGRQWAGVLNIAGYVCVGIMIGAVIGFLICGLMIKR